MNIAKEAITLISPLFIIGIVYWIASLIIFLATKPRHTKPEWARKTFKELVSEYNSEGDRFQKLAAFLLKLPDESIVGPRIRSVMNMHADRCEELGWLIERKFSNT